MVVFLSVPLKTTPKGVPPKRHLHMSHGQLLHPPADTGSSSALSSPHPLFPLPPPPPTLSYPRPHPLLPHPPPPPTTGRHGHPICRRALRPPQQPQHRLQRPAARQGLQHGEVGHLPRAARRVEKDPGPTPGPPGVNLSSFRKERGRGGGGGGKEGNCVISVVCSPFASYLVSFRD